jgi:hypothetical protein
MIKEGERPLQVPAITKEPGKETKEMSVKRQLEEVVYKGWPVKNPELGAWLDMAFRQPWAKQLEAIKQLPLGLVENLQDRTLAPQPQMVEQAKDAVVLLVARGLQLQANGDPAAFVNNFAIGLALVRQIRHRESPEVFTEARYGESILLYGLYLWLERLGKRPDLLRQTMVLLNEHKTITAKEAGEWPRTPYLIFMNSVAQPEAWVHGFLGSPSEYRRMEADLVTLAWQTPWEKARLQRLVRFLANRGEVSFSWPGPLDYFFYSKFSKDNLSPSDELGVQVPVLLVALCLYQAETGHIAKTLEELTPKFLESVPIDPITGRPSEYRFSRGERVSRGLAPGPKDTPLVPAGQAILTFRRMTFIVPQLSKK